MSRLEAELKSRKLDLYEPYARQKEFHNKGSIYRERLFMAGNQCVTPWTLIETVDGLRPAGEVFFGSDVYVRSWDGESECAARISHGFLRGIEPAFRVFLDNGDWYDCTANHQILAEQGWLEFDRLMSLSDVQHCWQRGVDLSANCAEGFHRYDPLPQSAKDTDLSLLLPQGGVQTRNLIFSREDAEARTHQYTNTLPASDPLPISGDVLDRLAALFAQFSNPNAAELFPLLLDLSRGAQLLHAASSRVPQVDGEPQSLESPSGLGNWHEGHAIKIYLPFSHPALVGYQRIVAVVPLGYQPIIDCHVQETNNYKAAGVYHHNCGKTYAGAAELAMHITGQYPDWWEGKTFDYANDWWVGGVTTEAITKGPQNLLLGAIGDWGKGTIPEKVLKNVTRRQGVPGAAYMAFVEHVSGKVSQITFKSYDQGREKWQAATLTGGVWFDEEPPDDIYSEGLTRINATDGITFTTFTPLLGMSNVVRMFYPEPNTTSRSITSMTINDVGHYTEEKKQQVIAAYLPHERKARALGLPFMGSGQVFPVDEEEITFDPPDNWKYPNDWPQIVGIDFGWDHPTAAVWLYWDRDNDIVYLSGCYRQSKEGIIAHAAAIRARGSWIPVAWPHDGLQHDKGSGETLSAQYRAQNVNMLHERAQFVDGGHGVEAGIQMLLERMETGRLKIERSCVEFWDEFRQYHRKDGLIVKERDDVISALRYGCMMLRYAKTKTTYIAPRKRTSVWGA